MQDYMLSYLRLSHGFEHGLNLLVEVWHQNLLQGLYLVQRVSQQLEAFQDQQSLLQHHVQCFQAVLQTVGWRQYACESGAQTVLVAL